MNKIVRKSKKQFKTEEEWVQYNRDRKARNKRDQREREKQKASITQQIQQKIEQVLNKIKKYTGSKNKSVFRIYREGFYDGLVGLNLNRFISLTCKNNMSLNTLISQTKRFVNHLSGLGLITNYFFVFEHNGNNYHVHLLVESKDNTLLRNELKNWGLGNTDMVEVKDLDSKINHIYYMSKLLNPAKKDFITQRLLDSWDINYISSPVTILDPGNVHRVGLKALADNSIPNEGKKVANSFDAFLKRLMDAVQLLFNVSGMPFPFLKLYKQWK